MAPDRVTELLRDLARGNPPPPDGQVEVVPQPPGPVAGVLSFTAHHVIAADVDPAWVHDRLPPWHLAAPMGAEFLGALAARLGREADSIDVVLAAPATAEAPAVELRPVDGDATHPRVERAGRYRRDLRVFETADRAGVLILGRGLAGRWEAAFEVEPGARERGLGRALVAASRCLVPADEHVYVQVAPGNVSSLRAVLGAGGFIPIGAEILFPE